MNDNTKPAATSGDAPDLQQLKALALAAHNLPDTFQPFVSSRPVVAVVVATHSLDRAQMDTVAGFYDAASPAVVLGLIARIERATAPHGSAAPTEPSGNSGELAQRAAAPVSGDDLEAFAAWKGYPLPGFNSDGNFGKDWLHREWVAFKAGRARAAVSACQAAPVVGGLPNVMDERRAFHKWFNSTMYRPDAEESMLIGWQARANVSVSQAAPCTNSDTWNCKYCRKTETCEALKDERNFGAAVAAAKVPTDEQIIAAFWKQTGRNWSPDVSTFSQMDERLGYFFTYGKLVAAVRSLTAPVEQGQGALDAQLRQEVAIMYQMLDDGEWAEHLAVTPHGQCLETAITRLIGRTAPVGAGVVPEEWQLVPKQRTDKMTAIGQDLRYVSVNSIGEIYRQMLAAAPTAATAHPVAADDQGGAA